MPFNISNVAPECHVERKVVEDYVTILEDLLVAVRLPSFQKRAKRRVVTHPKFFFFDTGVPVDLDPPPECIGESSGDRKPCAPLFGAPIRAHPCTHDLGESASELSLGARPGHVRSEQ